MQKLKELPCFITKEHLNILGENIKLIVGMGLQSVSDEVRETCIGAAIKKDDFLRACELLEKFNYKTKCYVMFKPPFLLEEEAITDSFNSVVWLWKKNIKDITLCPTRVAKQTILQCLFDKSLYAVPKLTSFAECLAKLQKEDIKVRVSIFNINSSDFAALVPYGCSICKNKILDGLEKYNKMEKVNFEELLCTKCKEQAKKDDPDAFVNLSFLERIQFWLSMTESTTQQEC